MTYIGHKYGSARDEVLHAMSVDGWANGSDGDVEAPTGFFAVVVNESADLHELVQAFESTIAGTEDDTFDPAELVGNFLVVEDSQGFVSVSDFASPEWAWDVFRAVEAEFATWYVGGDES